ncbi:DUF4234 domain-containing protein [bacterium]|nr:DUF4234 domain-containing protein [bacterium]
MSKNNLYSAIRKTSTLKLVILSIITFGIYWYIWLWKLITDINNIYPEKYIQRSRWFAILIALDMISLVFNIKGIQTNYICNTPNFIWCVLQLALALQILKNIEYYTKNKFNITVKHNTFGWLFFGCFYINYKINRLSKYIKQDVENQIKELKK